MNLKKAINLKVKFILSPHNNIITDLSYLILVLQIVHITELEHQIATMHAEGMTGGGIAITSHVSEEVGFPDLPVNVSWIEQYYKHV